MLKSVMRSLIGVTLIFAVAGEARADVQIVNPHRLVAGETQLSWAQKWWQWLYSVPAATNPINDQTGAFAANGNNFNVFFLAGTFGGTVSRTITVPYGKPVFFPIVNIINYAFDNVTGKFNPSPCDIPLTVSCFVGAITGIIDKATNMTLQVDDKIINYITTPRINMFRETSTSFFLLTLPSGNLLGVPAATYFPGNPVSVEDGYYIMLDKLSLGAHSLHFHGEIPAVSLSVDVTDTLNVVAP